jgi:hypothetical protein
MPAGRLPDGQANSDLLLAQFPLTHPRAFRVIDALAGNFARAVPIGKRKRTAFLSY